jgi:hypothetical protein
VKQKRQRLVREAGNWRFASGSAIAVIVAFGAARTSVVTTVPSRCRRTRCRRLIREECLLPTSLIWSCVPDFWQAGGPVIGELLPIVVALAVGPMQVIALVLILVSDDAGRKGIGFVVGRLLGLGLVVGFLVVVLSVVGAGRLTHHGAPSAASSSARVMVGVVLIVLAVRLWWSRPKPGEQSQPSALSRRIDTLTPVRAFVLGLLITALDPAGVSLALIAGLDIAGSRLPAVQEATVAGAFVLVATVTTTAPLLVYLIAGGAARHTLIAARSWLTANQRTVMMVLFLILGAMLIGRGIGDLTS